MTSPKKSISPKEVRRTNPKRSNSMSPKKSSPPFLTKDIFDYMSSQHLTLKDLKNLSQTSKSSYSYMKPRVISREKQEKRKIIHKSLKKSPKKSKGQAQLYLDEVYKSNPNLSLKARIDKWQGLDIEEKKKYVKKALEDDKKYEKFLKLYKITKTNSKF